MFIIARDPSAWEQELVMVSLAVTNDCNKQKQGATYLKERSDDSKEKEENSTPND